MLTRSIFLTGFSGSGKSVTVPLLAGQLGVRCVDVDTQIAQRAGKPIKSIFNDDGEKAFRLLEADVVLGLCERRSPVVVALGGGAVQNRTVLTTIKERAILVYLQTSVRALERRLRESIHTLPMFVSVRNNRLTTVAERMAAIKKLLDKRTRFYRQADLTVSTSDHTPGEVARLIVRGLKSRGWA